MHPQLDAIAGDYRRAQERLHRLAESIPADRWSERPEPSKWSPGECVAHLNLTTEGFRPGVERALAEGREGRGPRPHRYRRDPFGWLLWRIMPPPVRMRVKTAAAFVPASARPANELIAEFDRFQEEQTGWVTAADGLPLGRLWVTSPFNSRVRYNLFACLSILPRHQERHLWQAEQAWAALSRR